MTRPDPYAGLNLLADVFPDTQNAPLPRADNRAIDGGPYRFVPAPDDPRWHLDPYGEPRPRKTISRDQFNLFAKDVS